MARKVISKTFFFLAIILLAAGVLLLIYNDKIKHVINQDNNVQAGSSDFSPSVSEAAPGKVACSCPLPEGGILLGDRDGCSKRTAKASAEACVAETCTFLAKNEEGVWNFEEDDCVSKDKAGCGCPGLEAFGMAYIPAINNCAKASVCSRYTGCGYKVYWLEDYRNFLNGQRQIPPVLFSTVKPCREM